MERVSLEAITFLTPSTCTQGTFNLILKTPRLIDFDNKRNFFRSKIRQQHEQTHHHHSLRVPVRRAYVLEDSYNQVCTKNVIRLPAKHCRLCRFR